MCLRWLCSLAFKGATSLFLALAWRFAMLHITRLLKPWATFPNKYELSLRLICFPRATTPNLRIIPISIQLEYDLYLTQYYGDISSFVSSFVSNFFSYQKSLLNPHYYPSRRYLASHTQRNRNCTSPPSLPQVPLSKERPRPRSMLWNIRRQPLWDEDKLQPPRAVSLSRRACHSSWVTATYFIATKIVRWLMGKRELWRVRCWMMAPRPLNLTEECPMF